MDRIFQNQMQIIPINNKIQLEIEQPTAGGLDLSSKPSTVECGTIIGIPGNEEVYMGYKVGSKLFFKAWAVDIITYNKQTFYFIDADSEGICAIVKE